MTTACHLRSMCGCAYKPPAFIELHDQNKNTHRPYADHCASINFAPMSRDAGLAVCTTTEHDGGSVCKIRGLWDSPQGSF